MIVLFNCQRFFFLERNSSGQHDCNKRNHHGSRLHRGGATGASARAGAATATGRSGRLGGSNGGHGGNSRGEIGGGFLLGSRGVASGSGAEVVETGGSDLLRFQSALEQALFAGVSQREEAYWKNSVVRISLVNEMLGPKKVFFLLSCWQSARN